MAMLSPTVILVGFPISIILNCKSVQVPLLSVCTKSTIAFSYLFCPPHPTKNRTTTTIINKFLSIYLLFMLFSITCKSNNKQRECCLFNLLPIFYLHSILRFSCFRNLPKNQELLILIEHN